MCCRLFLAFALFFFIHNRTIAQPISQSGQYDVGFELFDAKPNEDSEIRTAVWYPTVAGAEGNSSIYPWGDYRFASPFLGVTDSDEIPSDQFPLIVLSHGWGAWGGSFAHLGESLASHGYVVAAPNHSTNDVSPRADELLHVVDAMLARSESAEDKFLGLVDGESIVIGGYSHGAVTTSTALRKTNIDVDAILLIDGSGQSWSFSQDIPVMHIGGGDLVFTTAKSGVSGSEFYAIDIGRADRDVRAHHWSFGLNGCQIREQVYTAARAAGATEQQIEDSVQPDSFWLGCNPAYIPPTEVQERMNVQAIAFLDTVLKNDDGYDEVLSPGHKTTDADLWLTVSVDSNSVVNGLAVLLTDPNGRSIGLDASTGETVDEFNGTALGNSHRARREVSFGLPKEALVPGDYVLTAVGTTLDATQNYTVQLGSAFDRGEDIVYSQSMVASGMVDPNQEIEPFYFTLFSPESEIISVNDLFHAIRNGVFNEAYDLNSDGALDDKDTSVWVEEIANTYFGDANLDGEFNSSDLVAVFRGGQYEDGIEMNSTWETGDWNGDGEFDTSDLVKAFGDGGFEKGPRATNVVPEPSLSILPIVVFLVFAGRRWFSLVADSAQRLPTDC